jgi:alkylhydroperoxidase family enzyme
VLPIYQRLFGDRDPVAEPGTATGTPGNWWTSFAQVPPLLDHMVEGFALFNGPERELAADLREVALTRAGFAAGSQFVFSQHGKAARNAGVAEEKLEAIPSSRCPPPPAAART